MLKNNINIHIGELNLYEIITEGDCSYGEVLIFSFCCKTESNSSKIAY